MFRLICILLIEILCGAEIDLFIPSFPELQEIFHLSPFMVQLTLSINFVAFCVCSLFAGALADRYNRRHVILGSLFIFVVGSVFCTLAYHYSVLLFGRLLQGIGIAGPATLAYVVIADENPMEKQIELMGILNGMITLAMAFAPIVGSFISYYFGWRGNFVLLGSLGLLCFVMSIFAIPQREGDLTIPITLKTYLPLFSSKKLLAYIMGICLFVVPYWLFISMAPILYMQDMGVPLKSFGFYQGSLIFFFALVSLLSPIFLRKFGQHKCFLFGIGLTLISILLILSVALLGIMDPILITLTLILYSIGAVFPVNILYPLSLEVVENSKGRTAALLQALRLISTAAVLQWVSYIYTGVFAPIGITIFICSLLSLSIIFFVLQKRWLVLE